MGGTPILPLAIWGNIDFSPGTTDRDFELWDNNGIVTIGHLYEKEITLI